MVRPISEGIVPWPAELVERFTAAGYWEGKSLGHHLWSAADAHADDVAVVDGKVRLSYAELVARADAAASRLRDLGVAAGDRIVVQLPNGWEFVVLTLACFRAGIVPVMALPGHRRHEMSYFVAHAEAVAVAVPDVVKDFDHQRLARELAAENPGLRHLLVAGEQVAEGSVDLRALCAAPADDAETAGHRARWDAEEPASSDVALFLLSGGTTGIPKLIPRSHDDYAFNAKESTKVCGFDADTVYLVSIPVTHNFPLACPGVLGTLLVGGTVVMLPSPSPARAFATIEREGVTHTAVVPAVAKRWLDEQAAHPTDQLASLKVLQVGGSRLADEVARRVPGTLGCTLQQVFGMAEGLLNYTRLDDPEEVIFTTQGRPMSTADQVLLVDEHDNPVPQGMPGSLITQGPYTLRGYYRAEEQNARAFTADGWYRSGDICRTDEMGNLIVEGRDKDMINRGGEKVSAEEVENLVYQLPAVRLVAAVAMPDDALGERVCLYVVPHDGASVTLPQIQAAMEDAGVARYKWPEHVEVVDELPTTKVGKINKKALRSDIAERLATGLGVRAGV
ncbi:AMP-binding protein [Georgenia sp. EYE_87]|uniref:(2,3-dihydroxybenzoyl)adenylate synthase n=1 Tax=Georgenia sp. EYE_87 TaxID=2853448 RepID=UPI002003512C|nr:AMP-binding protein [Georgenia sp. EYE_87]MCK6211681.1 AMP-binding protein [Georgenia sp. EYE_87]